MTCSAAAYIILILFLIFTFKAVLTVQIKPTFNPDKEPILVIDPGHGGFDPGAIGIDGSIEKDINLKISVKTNALAELFGVKAVMTRYDDTPRTDKQHYSEHEELVYRTELANTQANAFMLCIHQNTYPTAEPCGVQVLYSDDAQSKLWGTATQNNLILFMDKENRRVAQPAPRKLYITSNTNCPTLLIECGFISNSNDAKKLNDNDYQRSFSMVTLASFLQYIKGCAA